jgi:aspartate/methionine/tyrosine aminotransferase
LDAALSKTLPVYEDWVAATAGVDDPAPRHLTAFPALPVDDTAAFCERIARREGIVAVPGEYFGRAGHLRIGLGGDPDDLAEGLAALARLLP